MADNYKTEETQWEPTEERFVALLDVMGFKDYIARTEHEVVYNTMKTLSDAKLRSITLTDALYDDSTLFTTSFSDSIIIFSKDNTKESLEAISYATAFILAEAAKDSIPMKGAMAEGLLTVDTKKQIYLGQPLIDAHLLHDKEVNYYGVVCHNSMEKFIEDYRTQSHAISSLFKEISTPLKSGNISHINLNWFNYIRQPKNRGVVDFKTTFKEIIKGFKTKTSGNPRKYIDNTEAVFRLFYPSPTE
jgi:hypothetical protein